MSPASSATGPQRRWAKKTVLDLGDGSEGKRTNGIGIVVPLIDALPDIAGRVFTADAMLAQRRLACRLPDRGAHYMFTVKDNQKTLRRDVQLLCDGMIRERAPDFVQEPGKPEHGRIERRSIRVSPELNDYAEFPGIGQVFVVHREVTEARTEAASAPATPVRARPQSKPAIAQEPARPRSSARNRGRHD